MTKSKPTTSEPRGEPTAEDKIWEYCQELEETRGRKPAEWHKHEFARVDSLIASGVSKTEAIRTVMSDRQTGPQVSCDSFSIMYEQYQQGALAETFAHAVLEHNEAAGVAAVEELAARARRSGQAIPRRKRKKGNVELN